MQIIDGTALDVHPFGVQVETGVLLRQRMAVDVWPVGEGHDLSTQTVCGEIRWARPVGRKRFRAGVAFRRPAPWSVYLSSLDKAFSSGALTNARFLGQLVSSIDDGILMLDRDLRILAANSRQPFCLPSEPERLCGRQLQETSRLLALPTGEGTFQDLFRQVLDEGEEKRLCAYPYLPAASAADVSPQHFHIWISPIVGPQGVQGIIVRTRDVSVLQRLYDYQRENVEGLWLRYRYQVLGRLLDDLLEEIINPVSAVAGRLDLLGLKIGATGEHAGGEEIGQWREDLDSARAILIRLAELCRATARRRDMEGHGTTGVFSLNDLIRDELEAMDLRNAYRRVAKQVSLASGLPVLQGDYSHWASTFTALCDAMVRNMAMTNRRVLTVQTDVENAQIVLRLGHTGRALATPLDKEPALAILRLMRQKYGATVSIAGGSGHQSVTVKVQTWCRECVGVA